MKLHLDYFDGSFYCKTDFDSRDLPRAHGFRFDGKLKLFYTTNPRVASRLREYGTDKAKKAIDKLVLIRKPWSGVLPSHKDKKLYDFQKSAAYFALCQNRTYLALDPGLGKTIVARTVIDALELDSPFYDNHYFYFCPAFLTATVEEEFREWAANDVKIEVHNTNFLFSLPHGEIHPDLQAIHIISDSLLAVPEVAYEIKRYMDLLYRSGHKVRVFVDEAHRFNNWESIRTVAMFGTEPNRKKKKNIQDGILDHTDWCTFLSGTPMPNRPMELYPVLKKAAPETIDYLSRNQYGGKFCQVRYNHWGAKYSDGTEAQMKDLAKRVVGPFMLRMRKDVLDLPEKIEELLICGRDMPAELFKMDQAILKKYSVEDLMKPIIAGKVYGEDALEGAELHLATYRKMLGHEKIPFAVEFLENTLEEYNEPILVFGLHTEVLQSLYLKMAAHKPILITGKTPATLRHGLVKNFQENKAHKLVIANMKAGGIGLTMTRARRVLILEPDWVPGTNDQAGDRAHRIGQRFDVYIQYMVFKNSIDRKVMDTNLRKRKLIQYV